MLEGLKVVELATHIAAPAAAGMLAEWGAEVIKVESPGGDPMRRGYEELTPDGESPAFQLDNRGKRSVVLDIQQPEGRAALVRLIEDADVFLTNLRPRALKRARIDWDTLKENHPRLIYASVTGYGLQGAEADLPGFDVAAYWARGGVASLMTPKGQDPFVLRTGVGDHTCALATASGILAAAFERHRTGRGRLVETSLIRTGAYAVGSDLAVFMRLGRIASTRPRTASVAPLVNFYRSVDDRWVCLMPRDPRADWPKIATAAGREDLIDDPRFSTDKARRQNTPALVEALDAGFGALPFEELARRFVEADVVWAPVQTPAQLVVDPQAQAAGCFVETPDGHGGVLPAPAFPVRFPGEANGPKGPPPTLGQHTDAALREVGYSDADVAALRAAGAAA